MSPISKTNFFIRNLMEIIIIKSSKKSNKILFMVLILKILRCRVAFSPRNESALFAQQPIFDIASLKCYNNSMKFGEYNYYWPLVGNRHITNFLEKSLVNMQISGTYIFNGPDNLGKTTLALHFAKILKCDASGDLLPCDNCYSCLNFKKSREELGGDVHLLKREKDKKNISIEQVRTFISSINMTSYSSGFKIGIIKHADKLSKEAANALLKTLEEPKKNVVIVLITSNLSFLPKTIISRSRMLNFRPVGSDLIYDYLLEECNSTRDQAKKFSRLSAGRPALAKKFLEDSEFLDKYSFRASVFFSLADNNIGKRIGLVGDLFDVKDSNQESVKIAKRVLEIWQSIVRDLIFIKVGKNNLIQHEQFIHEFERMSDVYEKQGLVEIFKKIKQGENYLEMNVNPRLVLEEILATV